MTTIQIACAVACGPLVDNLALVAIASWVGLLLIVVGLAMAPAGEDDL